MGMFLRWSKCLILTFSPVLPLLKGDVPCKFMTLMQASPQKSAFQTTLPVCHQERELEGEGELEWTHGNVARLE